MKLEARKWLAASALLAASGLALWGGNAGNQNSAGQAQAAAPVTAQQVRHAPVRRESLPPVTNGPAPRTGPASPFKPLDIPNFGPNYRANTDTQNPNRAQQEPSIGVNPTNPLNVVAAAKDERAGVNTKQVWIYTSFDGGVTWTNQIFPLAPPASPFSSDPVVTWSDDGICYVTALPYGGGANDGVQVARSLDGGVTFQTGVHLPGTDSGSDKEYTVVDNTPSSPFYHRVYVAYMDFSPGFRVDYSTDEGQTWTQSSIGQPAFQFPMPITYPNGDVMVTFYGSSGVQDIRSTNGGVNWSGAQTISSISDPNCPPDNSGCSIWRLNAIPAIAVNPTNGNAVVVWSDGRSGTATIYYSRGSNNGSTWSPAQILAPPGVANTYQVEPWVTTDEQGNFHAIWYDDRENPNSSIFNIYYSESTDDGQTWSDAVHITDATTDLRIGIPSSYALAAGDYINVTASHGNVYGVWTDTRSGTGEDIYMVRGLYGPALTPTITPTGTLPTATSTRTQTRTPSPTPTTCTNYVYATATATIEPGTTDVGNHCDDCSTTINLPFPFSFYGQSFTTASVISNGSLQFQGANTTYQPTCPPSGFTYTVMPFGADLYTVNSGYGIYTSVSGSAPNRVFNIEWRAQFYPGTGSLDFEIRLYEGQSRLDFVYGTGVDSTGAVGVMQNDTTYVCYQNAPAQGVDVVWVLPPCGTVTATPTTTVTTVATNTGTPTTAPTDTATATATSEATDTPVSGTETTTPEASTTSTVMPSETATPQPGSPTVTSTPCTISFTDVHPTDYFYNDVKCVYCLGAVSGYSDGTFRPFANTTRGQMTKIIVLALRIPLYTPTAGATFNDVPRGSTFFDYVETAAHNQIVSGYSDGSFRPNALVTRGQLSKIDAVAANHMLGWDLLNPTTPTFSDVPPTNPFYTYIETVSCHGVVSGYSDGTFRWTANAIRAQIAKIVCVTSQDPPAQCLSGTPQVTVTPQQ